MLSVTLILLALWIPIIMNTVPLKTDSAQEAEHMAVDTAQREGAVPSAIYARDLCAPTVCVTALAQAAEIVYETY